MHQQFPEQRTLTIVTVTFNAASALPLTLQSVFCQTVFDSAIEYIIVDGGSTDGTLSLLNSYRSKISMLVSEPDHGIYDAMNKAAKLASCPWILFLNAGDQLIDEKTIETLLPMLSATDQLVYGDCIRIWPDGRHELRKANPFFNFKNCIPGLGICHQSIYMPTEWLINNPFDWVKYPHCADFDLVYNLRQEGRRFTYLDRPLCLYAYGEGFSSEQSSAQQVFDENARILGLRHSWIYYKQKLCQLLRK